MNIILLLTEQMTGSLRSCITTPIKTHLQDRIVMQMDDQITGLKES
jgi:hypothetical protein